MRRLNLKKINISFTLIIVLAAAACKKDTKYDITGDKTNRIYMVTSNNTVKNARTFRFSVVNTVVGAFGNVQGSLPVRATMPVASALKVNFAIDNELVSTFNSANNTTFIAMPNGVLDLSTASVTIAQGQQLSADSLKITIPTDKLSQLSENTYVLPIKISAITGDEKAAISNNQSVVYVIVNVKMSTSQLYESPGEADMSGSIITDRSKWSATIDQPLFGGSTENLFDGDDQSYFFIGSANSKLVLDLGESVSGITGVRIKNYFGAYGITTAEVLSSTDGVTWTSYGTANLPIGASQYIRPYKAFNARYIKLDITGWQSIYIALTEFDLYK